MTSTSPVTRAVQPNARNSVLAWRGWFPLGMLAPGLALLVFACALPMLIFLRYGFAKYAGGQLSETYSWDAYREFLTSPYYHDVLLTTVTIAAAVTAVSLLIGYPIAYKMWKSGPAIRTALAAVVFMPVLVSAVVRTYGWQILLADRGPINWVLERLGQDPVALVFNRTGVVISLVHICLPFVVFPLLTALDKIDQEAVEAAQDLGAGWWFTFRRVTLPLALPGLIAGAEISATLALGSFLMPALLGGGKVTILPVTIYNDTSNLNWPMAAVCSLALVLVTVIVVVSLRRISRRSEVVR